MKDPDVAMEAVGAEAAMVKGEAEIRLRHTEPVSLQGTDLSR